MSQDNPFAAPSSSYDPASELTNGKVYGGIGRLAYFGYTFLAGIIQNVLQAAFVAADLLPGILVALVLYLVALVVIVVQRLKNLGYSGWWTIGVFVPILNILVGLRLIACPEGYADHKTLDTAGKVIAGLFLALLVLVVVAVLFGLMAGP